MFADKEAHIPSHWALVCPSKTLTVISFWLARVSQATALACLFVTLMSIQTQLSVPFLCSSHLKLLVKPHLTLPITWQQETGGNREEGETGEQATSCTNIMSSCLVKEYIRSDETGSD